MEGVILRVSAALTVKFTLRPVPGSLVLLYYGPRMRFSLVLMDLIVYCWAGQNWRGPLAKDFLNNGNEESWRDCGH
jgi:hypothetical protein